MKIPKYIKLTQNYIGIDWELYKKSPEYTRECEKTEELVRYLKNEGNNR
jgi:hypothetical protein